MQRKLLCKNNDFELCTFGATFQLFFHPVVSGRMNTLLVVLDKIQHTIGSVFKRCRWAAQNLDLLSSLGRDQLLGGTCHLSLGESQLSIEKSCLAGNWGSESPRGLPFMKGQYGITNQARF